jgi:hypothetical protein
VPQYFQNASTNHAKSVIVFPGRMQNTGAACAGPHTPQNQDGRNKYATRKRILFPVWDRLFVSSTLVGFALFSPPVFLASCLPRAKLTTCRAGEYPALRGLRPERKSWLPLPVLGPVGAVGLSLHPGAGEQPSLVGGVPYRSPFSARLLSPQVGADGAPRPSDHPAAQPARGALHRQAPSSPRRAFCDLTLRQERHALVPLQVHCSFPFPFPFFIHLPNIVFVVLKVLAGQDPHLHSLLDIAARNAGAHTSPHTI